DRPLRRRNISKVGYVRNRNLAILARVSIMQACAGCACCAAYAVFRFAHP
ncbi:21064_t:CDS:1, partial [Gigaspora rosea]